MKRHLLVAAGLWLALLAAYSDSFRAGFTFDSRTLILNDSRVHTVTLHTTDQIWNQEYWYPNVVSGLYRPFSTLSFRFNYATLGNGASPAGYHWINFALHAANVTLVYLLGLILFESTLPAASMAALWGLHPALTESVINLVGRCDLLSGFGVLAALLCHIGAAAASGWRKAVWLCGLIAASAVAVYSKESGIVALAAALLFDLAMRRSASWRARLPGYVAMVLPALLFLYQRAGLLARIPFPEYPFADNPIAGAGFLTGRMTAVKVLGKYLGLMVWPRHLSCDYSWSAVPLFTPADWKAFAALAVCLALMAVAVWLYRREKRMLFFVAWFFVMLAPTANIAMPIGTVMAERFLYLPSIGFAGCAVLAIWAACRRKPAAAPLLAAAFCLALAGRTFIRNFDWENDETLWRSAVAAVPQSYKAHMALARVLLAKGGPALDEAVAEADRTVAILAPLPDERDSITAHVNAAACYRATGEYHKALAALLRAKAADAILDRRTRQANRIANPGVHYGWAPLYMDLGNTYLKLGEPRLAAATFDEGATIVLTAPYFEAMAVAYHAMGDLRQEAISLMEGLIVDNSQTRFASALAEVYRQLDPRGCAVAANINLECPLVRDHFCTAARNVFRRRMSRGEPQDASRAAAMAVREFACSAELFR